MEERIPRQDNTTHRHNQGRTPVRLRVWREEDMDRPTTPGDDSENMSKPWSNPGQAAEYALMESWQRFSGSGKGAACEPGEAAWFVQIANKRYTRHGIWLPRFLELNKHPNEKIVVYGEGLGTDAIQYCLHEAQVTFCTNDPVSASFFKRHSEVQNVTANVHVTDADKLPALPESTDIVVILCFHEMPRPLDCILQEADRILRPGGKLIAVFPNSTGSRLPLLKFSNRKSRVGQNRFTRRDIKSLLPNWSWKKCGLRHLRRSDLPGFARWLYFPFLERLFGRCITVKALKPIQTNLNRSQAA